jgi:hypothetical protein
MEVSGVGKVAANEPATIAASPTPVPDLVESTAPTPTREAVSGEQVASPSPVLETTSVSMESQIAPPTSVVRNVAIGSVVVIVVLIGFIVRQFVASRPGK